MLSVFDDVNDEANSNESTINENVDTIIEKIKLECVINAREILQNHPDKSSIIIIIIFLLLDSSVWLSLCVCVFYVFFILSNWNHDQYIRSALIFSFSFFFIEFKTN